MRRLSSERGTTIVTAVMLLSVMIVGGLSAYSMADTQQTSSTRERQREASFNYAESALSSQAFLLSRNWPGAVGKAYPASCTNTSAPAGFCPQPGELAAAGRGADFNAGVSWDTSVRDDTTGGYYDPAALNPPTTPRWDSNGNGKVWIRAHSRVRGRDRTLVAQVAIQKEPISLPQRTVIAGKFMIGPSGNQVYVKTNPDQTSTHPVTLRCPLSESDCAVYSRPKNVDPPAPPADSVVGSYQGGPALPDTTRESLRERADAEGKLFNGCPSASQLSGAVVWVENCPSGQYTANATYNSAASPGILIWRDGTLTLGGNSAFYGVIYHVNANPSPIDKEYVLQLQGGFCYFGGVFVDGRGGVEMGSNSCAAGNQHGNANYMPTAFTSVSTFGAAGLVQNSWREVSESNN